MKSALILSLFLLAALFVFAHDHKQSQPSQAGESDLNATTESMSHGHHHEMGRHMHMSALRDPQAGDEQKAQAVVDQAREALENYKDYNVALADGFKIFLPNLPQKMYHFTNWQYAVGEAFSFDPAKPTSLLYEKKAATTS